MADFSIGATWEDMVVFVRREAAILVPVAMATFGAGAILAGLALPDTDLKPGVAPQLDSRTLLIIPAFLLMLIGNLAVSAIALLPGITVRDALQRALRRLPAFLGAIMLAIVALTVVLIVIGFILRPLTSGDLQAAAILAPIVGVLGLALGVPMLLLSPVVLIEPVAPIAALRRVVQVAKGNFVRLFAILSILLLINLIISLIATLVIASLTKLAALAMGQPELITLVGDIVTAGVSAMLAMIVGVYLAFIYRRIGNRP